MYRRRLVKKVKPEFPKTLDGFGYVLKDNGEIRDKETDLVGDLVEERLQAEPIGFNKVTIPVDADPSEDPHTHIFMTPNALTAPDRLLVLIPGNNTRIGQWTRRAMCDDNINSGSMIEVAKLAKERGYETMILNPNGIFWYDGKANEMPPLTHMNFLMLPENDGPEQHCRYVFDHFISKAKAKRIVAMTLGWGGFCLTELLNQNFDFFKERVQAVAMADSTHSSDLVSSDRERIWIRNHVLNWCASTNARGEPVKDTRLGCDCISSGDELAEFTVTHCIQDMLRFIDTKMGDYIPEEVDDEIIREDEQLEVEEAELEEHVKIINIS
ncbi:Arb2 domain-containing protein [Zychaea mexicana]|uniref:Arb2 domain-containing protein n=1 Tax=Zychaea mexicana TaxID=64656 RepID=UPI0022FDE619|nr:Arb2 domain-containing protein [Zychaea mexicana]KAI9492880.1 Arb2 domain-containing protein [Zychaea mexicana]